MMIPVRKILARLSRGRFLKRKIFLNGQPWPLIVSPDAALKYLKPGKKAFGTDLIKIAENLVNVDSVVWDIGAARGRASNSLESVSFRSTQGGVREVQYVPILRLDSMISVFSAPDLVKIDVEGAESLVVAGAKNMIKNIRPVFILRLEPIPKKSWRRLKQPATRCAVRGVIT